MAACKCDPPQILEVRKSQLVRVEFGKPQSSMIYQVAKYCTSCRGVLEPAEYAWGRVGEQDHQAEMQVYRGVVAAKRYFGTANDAQNSNFIRWADLASYLHIPVVRRSEMFMNFTAISEQELRGVLRRYLHLNPALTEAMVPTTVGDVKVSHATVEHLFSIDQATRRNRIDADHVQMWPLVIATLRHPIEIWEANATATRPQRFRFLAMYHIGERLLTHLVIVGKESMTALTGYRLDPASDPLTRIEGKRELTSRYLRWHTP